MAVLVGLVIGTVIGAAEGIWVLQSQGLFGRYNELIAWAIVFDAPAMIGLEVGLAIISGVFFSFMEKAPTLRGLVSLQLGETAFVSVLGYSVWLRGTANPADLVGASLLPLLPVAIWSLLFGELVLGVALWVFERAPVLRRFQIRHLLAVEVVVILVAIAFGFSR